MVQNYYRNAIFLNLEKLLEKDEGNDSLKYKTSKYIKIKNHLSKIYINQTFDLKNKVKIIPYKIIYE